jgi:hypothetical protein
MSLSEQFDALSLDDLNDYVARGQEENLQLEFKTITRADLTQAEDKKNLAKALSGFANSSGGILVWGIVATKNAEGIDRASETREIDPLALLVNRLNEFTGVAVSPIVEGVKHKPIASDGDRGFAVTLVPESDSGPHMAKFHEDRYYKRSGDSFYRMEHYDLEDMFGRRKKPKLKLTTRLLGRGADTSIVIGIENVGRGAAKAPYLAFNITPPFNVSLYGLDGNLNQGLPKLHFGQVLRNRFGANANLVIHPGTIHEVTLLDLGINPRADLLPEGDVTVDYEISAEDSALVRGTINLGQIGAD